MTYWYPGVFETIRELKAAFPKTPLILGGIYARLCTRPRPGSQRRGPGRHRPARKVWTWSRTHPAGQRHRAELDELDAQPYPAFDLQRRLPYMPLLTARGCPFDCAYCAARLLEPSGAGARRNRCWPRFSSGTSGTAWRLRLLRRRPAGQMPAPCHAAAGRASSRQA